MAMSNGLWTPEQLVTAPITPAHLAVVASRGKWVYPAHLQYLNRKITDALTDPVSRFLLIELPIRHGKSEFISKFATAWFLGTWPDRHVMLASYGDRLAKKFSRAARDILTEYGEGLFGCQVRADSRAVDRWELVQGGGFTASPLHGLITGVGGDLIVIDDPIKDAETAQSKSQRDKLWEWYQDTLRGRLEPGGKMILVMSRWHADDLAGRLLVHSRNDPEADQWERVRLPAIAEPTPEEEEEARERGEEIDFELWRDELGRSYGEALWPDRWPLATLQRTRASISPGAFLGNYQQRPTAREGDKYARAKWQFADLITDPDGKPSAVRALRPDDADSGQFVVNAGDLDVVRRWDLADGLTGDWAAGALVAFPKKPPHFTFIIDVRRVRAVAKDVRELIVATAEEDLQRWGAVHTVVEQEPGSGGKTVAEEYVRDHLAGYDAEAKTTSHNKEINAVGLSGQQQAGNVFLLRRRQPDGSYARAPWFDDFIEEASEFPKGANDDMIDAAAQAYNDLVVRARERRRNKANAKSAAGTGKGKRQVPSAYRR